MSVRNIPMGRRSLTGVISSPKIRGQGTFESSLERDLLMLLVFDIRVQAIEVQPVRIEWIDPIGHIHSYTPDILAHYQPFWHEKQMSKKVLYEVKYRHELAQNWPSLRLKFKAALRFARKMGWNFSIITEQEIRTPYLENVKFLTPYKRISSYDPRFDTVIEVVKREGQLTVKEILSIFSNTIAGRSEILGLIWTMLAQHYLATDLSIPLNQKSILWVTQP